MDSITAGLVADFSASSAGLNHRVFKRYLIPYQRDQSSNNQVISRWQHKRVLVVGPVVPPPQR